MATQKGIDFSQFLPAIQNFVKTLPQQLLDTQQTGQNIAMGADKVLFNGQDKSVIGNILNPKGKLSNIPSDYANYNPTVIPALGSDIAEVPGGVLVPKVTSSVKAKPAELPPIENTSTDISSMGSYKRDMRTTVNPNFKLNPNPKSPLYSMGGESPSSGFTPEELAQQKANMSQTQKPSATLNTEPPASYNPPVRTEADLGKPGAIHINADNVIDSSDKQKLAQGAVDNIPGTTATQKFGNLHNRIGEISNQIDSYNTANPVNIPESTIKSNIVNKIKPFIAPEGMSPVEAQVQGFITQEQANIIADDTIRQLKMGAGIKTPSIGAQSDIPIKDVLSMKQSFNKIYGSLLDKRYGGGNLTAGQNIQLAARDGLDDSISQFQPKIKDLSLEQSGLYNSERQLGSLSNKEYEAASNKKPTGIAGIISHIKNQSPLTTALEAGGAVMAGPHILPAIESVGGTIIGGVSQLPKFFNNENQSNANQKGNDFSTHTSSITPGVNSNNYSDIKPGSSGTIDLPQTPPAGQNNRQYMSTQDYQNALSQLATKYPAGDRDPAYALAKTQIDTRFANDQKQADEVFKGNNVKNFMDNATQYNNDGKTLLGTLTDLSPNFWNGVKNVGSIKAYTDPAYASQLQQIDAFNNEYASAYESVTGKTPTNNMLLSSANSPEQAATKYTSMMQFIAGTYGKYLSPYLALTSATGTQTPQGNPSGSYLPPIQSAPTSGVAPNMQQTNFPTMPAIQ